jgi:tRNA A37 threonylcarbamoyladenosine dehydratase
MSVAVIGCSGRGSFVVEQLARLGVRPLVLVDPDVVEYKNLNRMLNAKSTDAALGTLKVRVLARAVAEMGLGTEVVPIASDLATPAAVRAVAGADVVFGCMDSVDGRHLT